ncbi:MAG TPA: serine hydrolase domain-containing protein, partial [Flavisolibacter sp.]|nr:serine hydrolase domain-containing protein [Flavisolibacter sp.]
TGFHDLRQKDSLHADIPFQIASTSKPFTAAAVLQLAEQGKLSLNDPVTKFFPQFPYTAVTVKMLLNHRSGLPNYLYYMEKGKWPRTQLASNTDVLNTLINWKPTQAYQPDRHFNYCNTNYVLLALIVEKASGQLFPEYLKQNIFTPLGMTNTFVHTMSDSLITQSYQRNGALWTLDFSDGPYGDKNIYSTPRDLLKWDQALYEGKVLSQPMLDSAFTPYSHEKPGVHNYGLGWRMLLYPNDKKIVYHNGHWHGFNSAFARLTDENATIIILSNKYNTNVYTTAKKLYNLFGNYDGKQDDGED